MLLSFFYPRFPYLAARHMLYLGGLDWYAAEQNMIMKVEIEQLILATVLIQVGEGEAGRNCTATLY